MFTRAWLARSPRTAGMEGPSPPHPCPPGRVCACVCVCVHPLPPPPLQPCDCISFSILLFKVLAYVFFAFSINLSKGNCPLETLEMEVSVTLLWVLSSARWTRWEPGGRSKAEITGCRAQRGAAEDGGFAALPGWPRSGHKARGGTDRV